MLLEAAQQAAAHLQAPLERVQQAGIAKGVPLHLAERPRLGKPPVAVHCGGQAGGRAGEEGGGGK